MAEKPNSEAQLKKEMLGHGPKAQVGGPTHSPKRNGQGPILDSEWTRREVHIVGPSPWGLRPKDQCHGPKGVHKDLFTRLEPQGSMPWSQGFIETYAHD